MVSVRALPELIGAASFPKQPHDSDRVEETGGEAIRASTGLETITTTTAGSAAERGRATKLGRRAHDV